MPGFVMQDMALLKIHSEWSKTFGSHISHTQRLGETPLILAAQHGSLECVAALTEEAGLIVAAVNVSGSNVESRFHVMAWVLFAWRLSFMFGDCSRPRFLEARMVVDDMIENAGSAP